MLKKFKKSSVKQNQLMESLLPEGGELNAEALAALNEENADGPDTSYQRSKSRLSNETKIEGLKEFNKYGDLFQDLTKREHVDTELDVININITYDSKFCIAIVNNKDEHFELQGYSLKTYSNTFKKEWKGEYIKMNVIEQTYNGTVYGLAYQDNGKFSVSFINN